jgi:hypothetical protein
LNRLFSRVLSDAFVLSVQNALKVKIISAPAPDVAILKFRAEYYSTGKAEPNDILLLIEVADSTVYADRNIKFLL